MPLFLEDRTLFDAELLNNLFLQKCPYMVFKILIDDENKTYTDFELKLKLTFYNYTFLQSSFSLSNAPQNVILSQNITFLKILPF